MQENNFNFDKFYNLMNTKGFVLYSGCLTTIKTKHNRKYETIKKDILNLLDNIKYTKIYRQYYLSHSLQKFFNII